MRSMKSRPDFLIWSGNSVELFIWNPSGPVEKRSSRDTGILVVGPTRILSATGRTRWGEPVGLLAGEASPVHRGNRTEGNEDNEGFSSLRRTESLLPLLSSV
jgi:hypothetical protein